MIPFSPATIFLRIIAISSLVLGAAGYLTYKKDDDPELAVAAILPSIVVFGSAGANNVIVVSKNVKKTVVRAR